MELLADPSCLVLDEPTSGLENYIKKYCKLHPIKHLHQNSENIRLFFENNSIQYETTFKQNNCAYKIV